MTDFGGYVDGGAPRYWMKETSGKLALSINQFLAASIKGEEMANREQFELVRDYVVYWSRAPAFRIANPWEFNDFLAKLSITTSTAALMAGLKVLLEDYGIDPL